MKKRILMVYPEFPETYWGFQRSLKFIGKKANFPPLGLLTVASLLPDEFDIRLLDMNVSVLTDADIINADMVFISAMLIQKSSMLQVIELCQKNKKTVVAGGPYPTSSYQTIPGVDHFVLDEAEITLPLFLKDLKDGHPEKIYRSEIKPDIALTPLPRLDLIRLDQYATMALQYSRGCPFNCEFCDIIELFGRVPRTKTPAQMLKEFQLVYETGYRGSIFIVDDNFIGNTPHVKELLPQIIVWQKTKGFPFTLFTEASINLAADEELMDMMVEAGFTMVFAGIETPVVESLKSTKKLQNTRGDLLESIDRIQRKGLEVTAGFIIGFDTDPPDIARIQSRFIQQSAVPMAMVGLLTALPNTQLYRRLKSEGRILEESSGDNTLKLYLNFKTVMDKEAVVEAYRETMEFIYAPRNYLERSFDLIKKLPSRVIASKKFSGWKERLLYLQAFFKSLAVQGFSKYGYDYFKFLLKTLIIKPSLFPKAVQMAITGHHFFQLTKLEISDKVTYRVQVENYLKKTIGRLQAGIRGMKSIRWERALKWFTQMDIVRVFGAKYARVFETSSDSIRSLYEKLDDKWKNYLKVLSETIQLNSERISRSRIGHTLKLLDHYRIHLVKKISRPLIIRNQSIRSVWNDINASMADTIAEIEHFFHWKNRGKSVSRN